MQSVLNLFRKYTAPNTFFKEVLLVIFCYLILLILFFGYDLFHYSFGGDLTAFYLPHYYTFLASIKQGYVPLWFPYSFLGGPELFKLEFGYFYPGTWLIFIINLLVNPNLNLTILGKTIQLSQYLHLLIGAVGTYWFCRKIIKLSLFSSFIAGMFYGFSIYTTSQIDDVSSMYAKDYFPFIMLFLILYLSKGYYKYLIILLILNVAVFTFGYPYNYIYVLFSELLLGCVYGLKSGLKTLVIIINVLLLSSVFVLPNYHIISHSYRYNASQTDPTYHTRFANVPYKIMDLVNPEMSNIFFDITMENSYPFFGELSWGTAALFFLIIGFYFLELSELNIWVLVILIITLLYSFGGYFGIPAYLGEAIKFFQTLRTHVSILFVTFFAGTLVFAQGLENVTQKKRSEIIELIFWITSGLLLFILFLSPLLCQSCSTVSKESINIIAKTFVLLVASLLFIRLYYRSNNILFLVILFSISFLEFHYYYNKMGLLHYDTSYRKFYEMNELVPELTNDNNLFRYSFSNDQFTYNTSTLNLYNLQGYETTPYSGYYISTSLPESDYLRYDNVKYVVTTDGNLEKNVSNIKLIRSIAPAAFLKETFISDTPGLTYWSSMSPNQHYVYQVSNFLPRFYAPFEVKSCLQDNCAINPPKFVTVDESNFNLINSNYKSISIKVISYSPNKIILLINSRSNSFIASSEIYDEGWDITENNKNAKIYNVNNGFRGFIVPKGKTLVVMSYTPPFWLIGLIISIVGIILIPIVHKFNKLSQ